MEDSKFVSLFKALIKNKKMLSNLSTGALIIAVAIVIFVWGNIYLVKSNIFDSMFTYSIFGPLPYIGIALCTVAFILSIFEKKPTVKNYI
jgi:hypothetical protein